jgi:nicotinamide phosphoribosyltransferase
MNYPHKTPRPLIADAYTLGSHKFESPEAIEYSEYYLTFRKQTGREPSVVVPDDKRIIFAGLSRLINKLLGTPVTHEEIDEAKAFLKGRKATCVGLTDFDFPEDKWREIVNKHKGYVPLCITGVPEGSVIYPNEPAMRVWNTVPGFGQFAAYFESTWLKTWAPSLRATIARHWLDKLMDMIQEIEKCSREEARQIAQICCHDFGDRAGASMEESEELGYAHLYSFCGTDTFSAAYQAWKDGAKNYDGCSVWALAHRIVQGFVLEPNCYTTLYNQAQDNSILSMVADCYDYYNAVENYLLPLAQRSIKEGNGKIVVVRPDSGDPLEQILWTIELAIANGLYERRDNGYIYPTSLKIIEGDGMDFVTMIQIYEALMNRGYAAHAWVIFGVGGHLRNTIRRDDLSAKYALCAVGENVRPVVKRSETPGKTTLPSCKVVRNGDRTTILSNTETGHDIHQIYYYSDGENITGCIADFAATQNRVLRDFEQAPRIAGLISPALQAEREAIIERYCNVNTTA